MILPCSTLASAPGGLFFIAMSLVAVAVLVLLWRRDLIRPGSPGRWTLRELAGHSSWAYFAAALICFLTQQLVMAIAAQATGVVPGTAPTPRDAAIAFGVGGIAGLAAGLWLLRHLSVEAPGAGLRPRAADALRGILLFLPLYPIIFVFAAVSGWAWTVIRGEPTEAISHETLRSFVEHRDDPWAWVTLALAVIIAPLVEEILYRGLLQSALVRLTGRVWGGVLITSALFAAAHMGPVTSTPGLLQIFVLSTALGLAYEKSRRLGVPIGMHVAFNAVNVGLALLLVGAGPPGDESP